MIGHEYEFKMKHYDGTELIVKGNKEALDDLLIDVRDWLLGCGYQSGSISEYLNLDE